MELNSFKEVGAKYNDTKPMVSKNHTLEQDIRPIGERRHKWQRIKKLSDNCYALLDGYSYGDDVFRSWWFDAKDPDHKTIPTPIETHALAPIVWERVVGRNKAGDRISNEVIKIRNGTGDTAHNSRYAFLDNYLPRSTGWTVQSGKQFVYVWTDKKVREKFFLPKSNYIGPTAWDAIERLQRGFERKDDNKQIILMREEGTEFWCNIGNVFTPKKKRSKVDSEAKEELKPWIDNFWDWACALGTVLPADDFDYVHTQKQTLYKSGVVNNSPYGYGACNYNGHEVRRVLKSVSKGGSESPEGLALLVCFLSDTEIKQGTSSEDLKTFRAKFNTFINRSCGLVDKWEEPVDKVIR
jgi:hypothetical protein